MIFLTVGTQFSFDRLVKAVDQAVEAGGIKEKIYAQIGKSSYKPRSFKAASSFEKSVFDRYFCTASSVISHAGMGTITMALNNNKPLLVMPRRKKYGEVVNDHQIDIAREFERFGYILVAYRQEELPQKIEQLKSFVPRRRVNNSQAIIDKVRKFLISVDTA